MSQLATEPKRSVLVVDDEDGLRSVCNRLLTRAGYDVVAVGDGASAIAELGRHTFDAVLSDIQMPGLDGIALLRRIRERDLDVPVLLMTGAPSLDTAIRAVELGALRYIVKPFRNDDLVATTLHAVRLCRLARIKRDALGLLGDGEKLIGDRAGLQATFDRALGTLWMAYQPIVDIRSRKVFGHEALVRSVEPALPHPGALFDAAERLQLVHRLGQTIRRLAPEPASQEACGQLFVNLHARDLLDATLYDTDTALARMASRVVLEITERVALDEVPDAKARIRDLRAMGYRIAVDDLGAGYAGLTSFALMEPELVKLDMAITRDVDREPVKRSLVTAMVGVAHELGMLVVAEGIERPEERDVLVDLGCDLLQGFLFARPGRPFPALAW